MKKVVLLAGFMVAFPLFAQNPPAQNPPDQKPPAQNPPAQTPPAPEPGESSSSQPAPTQNPPADNPPAQGQPQLEKPQDKPQLEAPGEAPADTPAPTTKKNDIPTVKPSAKRPGENEGKVVEEIVARVNNDIITKSELDKARSSSADDSG